MKRSEIADRALWVAAGIEGNIPAPSCPERWTSREGGPVRDRAGKGKVSRRKPGFC